MTTYPCCECCERDAVIKDKHPEPCRTCQTGRDAHYSPHVKADTPDPRLHVLERRLPDWPTDDLADLLAELDTAVTL